MIVDANPYCLFSTSPPFGGIQTKTAHIFYALGLEKKKFVYTLGKKVENKLRPFGYGLFKRNIPYDLLDYFEGDILFADLQPETIDNNIQFLKRKNAVFSLTATNWMPPIETLLKFQSFGWKFMAIRESIATHFKKKGIKNIDVVPHLWYEYPMSPENKKYVDDISLKKGAIACCRLDFKKKIEIIFDANDILAGHENTCYVHGSAESMAYKFHVLKLDRLNKYWKGKFDKEFNTVSTIQAPAKFGVNLSQFKEDGGGTENTTLEYIYHNVAVILHRDWIRNGKYGKSDFEEGYNCFAIDSAQELADLLSKNPDTDDIVKNARKILKEHTSTELKKKWSKYVKI